MFSFQIHSFHSEPQLHKTSLSKSVVIMPCFPYCDTVLMTPFDDCDASKVSTKIISMKKAPMHTYLLSMNKKNTKSTPTSSNTRLPPHPHTPRALSLSHSHTHARFSWTAAAFTTTFTRARQYGCLVITQNTQNGSGRSRRFTVRKQNKIEKQRLLDYFIFLKSVLYSQNTLPSNFSSLN